VAVDKQEVPSRPEGQLVVIGTDLQPGEPLPPADRLVTVELTVLAIERKPEEQVANDQLVTIPNDPKKYRLWKDGDPLEPRKLAVAKVSRTFRRLEVGDEVKAGQTLAVVDPTLTFHDVAIRRARLDAIAAERIASEKTRDEAKVRYDRLNALYNKKAGFDEELSAAKLAWERYQCEETSKAQARLAAERELGKSQALLQMHEIRSSVSGVIKEIYKNRGEAVYPLESVFQIQNTQSLRLEGQVDVQHLPHLHKGLEVVVEPTRPVRPLWILRGHLQAITGVAVSKGPKPLIVSASEDGTVRIWDPQTGLRLRTLRHPAAVRAVACTPPGAKQNLCLAGASDGSARLWELDRPDQPARQLSARHKAAVTCVAFSPDGEWCATGGEDHAFCLWRTRTGEQLACLADAHHGEVTSLQFASGSRLLSAGRDNRLLVWALNQEGRPRQEADLDGRGAEVTTLGVSPDGRLTFFDHGSELRLLSLADQETEAVFQNTTKDLNFTTLALFAPDGRVLLTGGAPEAGLQLWRAPTSTRPAGELRRLIWADAPATCGAFAPDGSFVVSGTQDRNVLVWEMPTPEEVELRLTARITLAEPFLSASSGQARIWAELKNPGSLIPGSTATMVIASGK
jgi:WD40 repeat protein